jgi:teichuronic acid biosynthesis glycosyltransferase TuaG
MNNVSVIIPYFRSAKFISKTLESVLKQTYKNFEVIIIFDDNDLNELKLLKKIIQKKKKIKLILNKKNIGAGPSRNKGAIKANGKYLAFIDSDDLWKKRKLKTQINFMQKNKLDISHTRYSIIDEKNKIISYRSIKNKTSYNDLLNSCDIGLSTVIIKKKLFLKHRFSSNKTKEDYSLWLKVAKKIDIYGYNLTLTSWRKVKNSLSSNTMQKLSDAFNIYHKQEKFNVINALYRVVILSCNFIKKSLLTII